MSETPETDPRNVETIQVFAVDLPMPEAARFAEDGARLSEALGGVAVEPGRVEALDTRALGDYGLAGYLTDGEGASADAILPEEGRLDAVRGPVLVLRPRAVSEAVSARPPLSALGAYPLERGRPAGAPIRSASAEGLATGMPPEPVEGGGSSRRASGIAALVALAVALLIALLVWAIAA